MGNDTCRSTNPNHPKWSSNIDATTCPASARAMNPEAPSLGSSTNANEMKHTPNAPPAHIHNGALLINASEGNGKRNARMIGSSTRMLTTREARVAHNG
ncbi:hypothetical protein D3C76_1613810 [compost metagenome]